MKSIRFIALCGLVLSCATMTRASSTEAAKTEKRTAVFDLSDGVCIDTLNVVDFSFALMPRALVYDMPKASTYASYSYADTAKGFSYCVSFRRARDGLHRIRIGTTG